MTAGPVSGTVFEDFDDPARFARWVFYNGAEFPGAKGRFERQPGTGRADGCAGGLQFDFTGGGAYVAAHVPLPTNPPVSHVRLWVRKPHPHRLTVRATDSEGQTFQKSFSVPHTGWQELLISLSGWTGFWGGKGDGVFRGAPTQFGLLVENTAAPRTGTVWIDDVRLLSLEGTSGHPETSYVAAFGAGSERWGLGATGDAGDSRWDGRVLRCDFRRGARSIGLYTDLALMGQPSALALRVRSTAPGVRVRMRLASHFQQFERVLATLRAGEQTLEAPLAGLSGWQFGGGENDGVVRYPLRVVYLGVERGAADASVVEVECQELRVRTHLAAAESVVLVPEGRVEAGSAAFDCELRNLLPGATEGLLTWIVRDYAGAPVARGRERVRVGQGESVRRAVQHPMGGRAFLECEFRFVSRAQAFGPVVAAATAPMPDAGDPTLRPESPFGMGLYLYRYPGDAAGLALMDRAAALGQAAGVKWSREEFLWHRIEPERGRFRWEFYDAVVETAHKHGISIYGLIDYWAPWTTPYTPEGIADYARYCTALVSRYKGRIRHWEVWNEPNIFFWSGPREMYADLLKAAYQAIKAADPEAQVLGCSTAGIDRSFIQQVMAAGAPFDILTIHPYRERLDDEAFIRELQETAELLARADGARRPVWITEMGWSTQLGGGVTERQQAHLLARCYVCTAASGSASNVSWYDFREDGENPFYNEARFGVVRHRDLSPKPAYRALATVCRTLAGQAVQERLDLGPDVLAYRFAGEGRETVALWCTGRDRLLGVRSDGPVPTATNLMGEPATVSWRESTGLLVLQADSPVFLTGRRVRVSAAPSPFSVDAPSSVHPGERLRVRCRASGPLAGAAVRLEVPRGWRASRAEGGERELAFEVQAPAMAAPGRESVILVVGRGRQALRLLVSFEVVPALLNV